MIKRSFLSKSILLIQKVGIINLMYMKRNFKVIYLVVVCCIFIGAKPFEHKYDNDRYVANKINISTIKTTKGYDAILIKFEVNAKLADFVKTINDVTKYTSWVYRCVNAENIYDKDGKGQSYKSVIDFPFPLSDRILAVKSDQHYKDINTFISVSESIIGQINADNFVPINFFESKWEAVQISSTRLMINYFVSTEPGGKIPSFVYNLAVKKGPRKTMENLIELIEKA
jgi:hypothetical protein